MYLCGNKNKFLGNSYFALLKSDFSVNILFYFRKAECFTIICVIILWFKVNINQELCLQKKKRFTPNQKPVLSDPWKI